MRIGRNALAKSALVFSLPNYIPRRMLIKSEVEVFSDATNRRVDLGLLLLAKST